jgi:hypothetical protein
MTLVYTSRRFGRNLQSLHPQVDIQMTNKSSLYKMTVWTMYEPSNIYPCITISLTIHHTLLRYFAWTLSNSQWVLFKQNIVIMLIYHCQKNFRMILNTHADTIIRYSNMFRFKINGALWGGDKEIRFNKASRTKPAKSGIFFLINCMERVNDAT